jgi:hypothetical protein
MTFHVHVILVNDPLLRWQTLITKPLANDNKVETVRRSGYVLPRVARAPAWLAGALFRLEVFGSNQASTTKVSSLSITSQALQQSEFVIFIAKDIENSPTTPSSTAVCWQISSGLSVIRPKMMHEFGPSLR